MSADFLFVLCKENANRLIRYVGYGNAAGFLASRGLMMGNNPNTLDGDYSDDQDSEPDDEEQDPVTGRVCFAAPISQSISITYSL